MTVLGDDLPVTLADGTLTDHVNLDYAATAPCLAAAAEAVNAILPWYASVHRGAGAASQRCTLAYERARQTIGDFVGARPADHVVFTRNTTDALNLLARALPAGTTVVGWAGEHHANLLPWTDTVSLPVPRTAAEAIAGLEAALADLPAPPRAATPGRAGTPGRLRGTVLVTVTGASNVTGEVWPLAALTETAHRHGARIAVDAAQLAPHRPVSLAATGIDYLALSGHKLYAPFGAGVLVGRADWLDAADPYLAGGGATAYVAPVTDGDLIGYAVDWNSGPARHEAGTPNLLGAVALAAVCETLAAADRDALAADENALVERLRDGLAHLPGVEELRKFTDGHDRVGIVSFAVAGVPAADVSAYLATRHGIGVRDGLFCAHPLTERLLADASARAGADLGPTAVRASVGLGSTPGHVDRLLTGLAELTRDRFGGL
ncbi:aminotransferase class V-fold PLP-dependent enzyme [Cryptosporangium arvum]|uniref:aminotransferase class V-fold PLP-dependent enzyme n=1 Tax=Cryptosporangium arvum TaxID=80871 RepID=UPI0004B3358D|nr:aminotransferase class V-fold PLP-dependent enzyme [Cryptosporangium arvum]